MKSENRYEGFDGVVVGIVRKKARLLARRPEFKKLDVEDLEQELMTTVAAGLAQYDATRSAVQTYVRRIVDHKAKRLMEYRLAMKRAKDLETTYLETTPAFIADAIPGERTDDPAFHVARRLDLEAVIRLLPVREQELCEQLRHHSVSEVSKLTGIPRATIYESIHKIRNVFLENEMKEYVV